MKSLIGIVLLFVASCVIAQEAILLPIIEVHDGDTIKTSITLPAPLDQISVRINGIDTPEMPAPSYATTGKLGRAKCVKEAKLALKAKQFVLDITNGHPIMTVTDFSYGKYASRILGTVYVNNINIGQSLIDNGLAVEYHGGTKITDWCQ